MTYKQYLTVMIFGTLVSWFAFGFVLFRINPYTSGWMGAVFFYLSLYLAVCGTFAVLGFIARIYLTREKVISRQAGFAFRQAVLFASLPVGGLILQSRNLFTWWNTIIFIGALTVIELFFVSISRKR
jgi:hypothetical protein